MKDFGNSFSRGIRIRAAGFVLFCSRVFLRSSGGLGVQAASGAGWERAARLHVRAENTTPRSFRSVPALEQSPETLVHFFGRDLRTDRHDALQNQKIPSLTFPSTVSFNGYGPLFASNFNSLQMKDFRKSLLRTLIPELKLA